jgi:uncharacterized glyoxalase superfamily protein PhnB
VEAVDAEDAARGAIPLDAQLFFGIYSPRPPNVRSHTRVLAPMSAPNLLQLTPVMVVDAVEPCLSFWVDRLGFTVENSVPGDDGRLVFASAKRGGIEVMYQTRASVIADRPAEAGELEGHSITLFLHTDDLDGVERAMQGAPVVVARHKTFYGSEELYVREPGGNTVGFAQF